MLKFNEFLEPIKLHTYKLHMYINIYLKNTQLTNESKEENINWKRYNIHDENLIYTLHPTPFLPHPTNQIIHTQRAAFSNRDPHCLLSKPHSLNTTGCSIIVDSPRNTPELTHARTHAHTHLHTCSTPEDTRAGASNITV